jgi:hypothetical protein
LTTITTESGSRYEIDDDRKTWRRLQIGNPGATTRTAQGEFSERSEIAVGERFEMFGESLTGPGYRWIKTTPVVTVESGHEINLA